MAKKDCTVKLFETGLLGSGDEGFETANALIEKITTNPENYDISGSVDLDKLNKNLSELVKEQKLEKRKKAFNEYQSFKAAKKKYDTMRSWQAEYFKQTGKEVQIGKLFEAMFVGWNGKETLTGGKNSIETSSAYHMASYQKQLTSELEKIIKKHGGKIKPLLGAQDNIFKDTGRGIKDFFDGSLQAARRDFNLDVYRVMEGGEVKDPIARDVASLLGKLYKQIAQDINSLGGNIKIKENYNPHSHNAEAILAAGKRVWTDDIKYRLNWAETYPEGYNIHQETMRRSGGTQDFADSKLAEDYLENLYHNITTGTKNEFSYDDSKKIISKRASRKFERARTLQFKSPDDYAQYANRFSTVDALSVAMQKIRTASAVRSSMEHFGPYPERTIKQIKDKMIADLRARESAGEISEKEMHKQINGSVRTDKSEIEYAPGLRFDVEEGTGRIGGVYHTVMGYSDLPVNSFIGKFSGMWRTLSRFKLGAMNISAMFGDTITMTMQAKRVKGKPTNLFELFSSVANRFDWRDRDMVELLGIESDEFFGAMHNRFDSPDSLVENKRKINRFQSGILRWTGTQALTDNARHASQRVHMRALAKHTGKTFEELHPDVSHDLQQAGITAKKWEVIRKNVSNAGSGRKYLLPRDVQKSSNKDIDTLLPEKLRGDREARGRARDELEETLKKYYIVGDRYAVIQMDARSKYWATLGTKRGTLGGEAWRALMQFKNQPISASNLIFREGRAGSTVGGLNSLVANLGFLGTSLVMGYAAMSSKDLIAGKTPRPINEKSAFESMAYSGGLGFIWDMFTNDIGTYGNPFAMFGPIGGDFGLAWDAVIKQTTEVMTGEKTLDEAFEKSTKDIYRIVKGWIPRLWFMRLAMDYYIFNPIEETLSPGSMRKRQRKLLKNTGQEYLLGKPAHNWR